MADELSNDSIDAIGASPAAVDTTVATPPVNDPAPAAVPDTASSPESGEAASGDDPNKQFFDEIDNLDGPAAVKSEPDSKSGDTPSLVQSKGDAVPDKTSGTAESQTKGDPEKPDDAPEASAEEGAGETAEDTDKDWSKINPETEAYIKKLPSTAERQRARAAERASNMQRSFLNPLCPAEQFVTNLQQKSAMRFGEVESAILKTNVEKDPIGMLNKVFEATADDQGNSEAYKRLMDTMVDTNMQYVLDFLKDRGMVLTTVNGDTSAKPVSEVDPTKMTDQEIDEFESSAAYQQLQETFPEQAEKLKTVLDTAKAARAKVAEFEAAKAKEQENQQSEEQKKAQEQEAAQRSVYVSSFSEAYESNVTTHVNSLLDKDYGLAVSAEEKEKNPMMAFLKSAKRKLIEFGGLDGSGDFDNDLHQWGQTRPAFTKAAKAMVEFAKAGEKENIASVAKELTPFAELFLTERLKLPELKLIDELIQIVAKHQLTALDSKQDTLPDSALTRAASANGSGDSLLDEIDGL